MTYGKIVDGVFQLAPKNVTVDNVTYKPATSEAYVAAGYKPVIYENYPSDGNTYEVSYTETEESIIQGWTLTHELTPEERRELAYETETCCEYQGANYTCDQMEDLYYKYFAESGKEELCATLKAIITAGKAHIREEYPDESEV